MFEAGFGNRLLKECLERKFHLIVTNEMRLKRLHRCMFDSTIRQHSIVSSIASNWIEISQLNETNNPINEI